jgi:hypothetical protein
MSIGRTKAGAGPEASPLPGLEGGKYRSMKTRQLGNRP